MAINNDNPLMLMLGLVVAITASVTFGIVDVEVLNNTINPYAGWVFIGGLAGIYVLTDRQVGEMSDYEAVSFLIPILAALLIQFLPQAESFLTDYEPYAGIVLTALVLGSFYALGTNISFNALALEIGLAMVLGVTAAVQFDVITLEVLNNNIQHVTIWVFVLALAGAYLISERDINRMQEIELAALGIGIGAYTFYEYVPQFENFVANNNPISGVVLTIVVIFAYYVLMNNGDWKPNY